jgi:hypothetical protein
MSSGDFCTFVEGLQAKHDSSLRSFIIDDETDDDFGKTNFCKTKSRMLDHKTAFGEEVEKLKKEYDCILKMVEASDDLNLSQDASSQKKQEEEKQPAMTQKVQTFFWIFKRAALTGRLADVQNVTMDGALEAMYELLGPVSSLVLMTNWQAKRENPQQPRTSESTPRAIPS